MKNQLSFFNQFLVTPNKTTDQASGWCNSSRSFRSTGKHRKPIFQNTSLNSTSKKLNKLIQTNFKQTTSHFTFNQVISDDFCGCETTLNTCKRITKGYFNNISLTQLKNCYENHQKPLNNFSKAEKKLLFSQLPAQYPEIYYSHLSNLLDHFEPTKFSSQCFLLLSWIHVHCKFQHITFFFYCDLKDSMKSHSYFYDQLQLSLIRENLSYHEQIRYFESLSLSIRSFLNDYYQSAGANLIPFTQYAKFLQIVKQKGNKALVQVIQLFIVKKRQQFAQILKYWSENKIPDLRNYSRYLNWDLFFNQIK